MESMNCLFCKIVANEIPSEKVFENDNFLAFLDINPVNPGHTLLIPKHHVSNFLEMESQSIEGFFATLQNLSRKVKDATAADGINIMNNNEEAAGQEVFHLHFHIIPRWTKDGLHHWQGKPYESDDERKKLAEEIRNK